MENGQEILTLVDGGDDVDETERQEEEKPAEG